MTPTRIAIVKPSALGDIAHALPVLTAVRELFPVAHIAWVVNKAFEPLLAGHPHLDETIPFDRGAFRKGLLHSLTYAVKFGRQLRRRRFDLVLDLQGLLRTGLMTAATRARVRIGFDNAREGSRYFYTRRIAVPDADSLHAVDRYWRVVEALGGGHLTKQFVVPVLPKERERSQVVLEGSPRPWIAVAVGAKWLTKRWPPAHFAEVLRRAQAEFGGTVVLIGSAEDVPLSAQVTPHLTGEYLDLTGKTSMIQLVGLLATCDIVLGNDTGPLHLAAALGKPCVAPYTCTKVALHGPYEFPLSPRGEGRKHGTVATTVPCAGSYLKTCPNGMICMPDLTPDKLWPAFQQVLRRWAAN